MNHKDSNIRQYAWDYFHFHAGQRLKTFEFYIVIATVFLSGYAISLKEDNLMPIGIILGLLLTILSFVFWKLDVRNRQLIKNSEKALKIVEKGFDLERTGDTPHTFELFNYDEFNIKQKRSKSYSLFWQRHFSYSNCFDFVFGAFAILGVIATLWTCCCLVRHSRQSINTDVKPDAIVIDSNYTEIEKPIPRDAKGK